MTANHDTARETRRRRILRFVDAGRESGLEIGALDKPVVPPASDKILYADRLPTEALRALYESHGAIGAVRMDDLVPVDIVAADGAELAAAMRDRPKLDYVVASHVIEHVPDVIGWLAGIGECLRPGGILALAVPDKRFTFDHRRDATRPAELVEAHLRKASVPTPAQVYDALSRAAEVEGASVWLGRPTRPRPLANHDPAQALLLARLAAEGGFHDVHCSVFTPASFAEVLGELIGLGLVRYEVLHVDPTRFGESEFMATLRFAPDGAVADRLATLPALDPRLHHELPRPWEARVVRGILSYRFRRWLGLPPAVESAT